GGGVERQPGNAPAAVAQASSTCVGDASRTAATSSVASAGLNRLRVSGPSPATRRPPIRFAPATAAVPVPSDLGTGFVVSCCAMPDLLLRNRLPAHRTLPAGESPAFCWMAR